MSETGKLRGNRNGVDKLYFGSIKLIILFPSNEWKRTSLRIILTIMPPLISLSARGTAGENAVEYFYKAIQADDTFIYAHHNYACVLALNYWKSDINEIVKHLQRELDLDPQRITKILSDEDLDNIRSTQEFINFILDGNNLSKYIYSPAPGSCASGLEIRFYPDGTAAYHEVWENGITW